MVLQDTENNRFRQEPKCAGPGQCFMGNIAGMNKYDIRIRKMQAATKFLMDFGIYHKLQLINFRSDNGCYYISRGHPKRKTWNNRVILLYPTKELHGIVCCVPCKF